ncbi:hypothetical protein PENSPDRAFT_748804 [Peniophora sp. CONT]|nr:hypothetical protein PENSPDRAFT_748804 [Peniophora sp. CONT]
MNSREGTDSMEAKRAHNARNPAVSLPPELLRSVFAFCPAAARVKPGKHINLKKQWPPWLAICGVCSRWREIYVAYPQLWVMPREVARPELLELFIARSQNLPFYLNLGIPDARSTAQFSDKVLETIQRSKSIRIRLGQGPCESQMRALDHKAAPLAEIVWIESAQALDISQSNLFDGQLPRLRILVTVGCDIPWRDSLLRTSLTVLSIAGITFEKRPSLDTLLNTLSRLSNLEELVLFHCLPIPTQHVHFVPAAQRIRLDRLRLFRITSRSSISLGALTASVLVPATAVYEVCCENLREPLGPHEFHDAILLGETIVHHYQLGDTPRDEMSITNDFLFIDGDPEHEGEAMGCNLCVGVVSPARPGNEDEPIDVLERGMQSMVKLRLRWTSLEGQTLPSAHFRLQTSRLSFLYAIRGIPVATLRGIAAVGTVMRLPAMWQLAFERAQAVTTVSAAASSAHGAIDACVLDLTPTTAISQVPETLFPALKTMHLAHLKVNRQGEDGSLGTVYDYLRILLRTRRDAVGEDGTSKALARLGVRDVDLTEAQTQELGSLLSSGHIDWDKTVDYPV